MKISDLVENKNTSFHEIAFVADHAGMSPRETGNLVHRVAELRTLRYHRSDILAGERFVELNLSTMDGEGEIDLVTIRGNKHYLHDYKPINLQAIQDKDWAEDFNRWLEVERNGDYRRIGNYRSMPSVLRTQFKQFLQRNIRDYHKQLDTYQDAYAVNYDIQRRHIKKSVVPYYVKR